MHERQPAAIIGLCGSDDGSVVATLPVVGKRCEGGDVCAGLTRGRNSLMFWWFCE